MVKPFVTLASRVLRAHQELTPCITRIQYGFMAERNIEIVEKSLQEMQEMIRDMRQSLKAPTKTDSNYIPLK
jgi:hypothetical protein